MNKRTAAVFSIGVWCFGLTVAFADPVTAQQTYDAAIKKDTVLDSIEYINKQIPNAATASDKRSLLFFAGTLQEQTGLYDDASFSYAQAAGIAAGDADGMQKVSSEQLVIDAVRASLCAGDSETADRYLNSAVRSSKDDAIIAYVNLYAQWSALCKAQSPEETKDAVALLKAYSGMDSMRVVKPAVLLTLWYMCGDDTYGEQLKKEFPNSPETGIVKGKTQIMSVPFWYFVPHVGTSPDAEETTEEILLAEKDDGASADNKTSVGTTVPTTDKGEKITREQCGLFRERSNADALVAQLKKKNFDAKITTETRASGTTYYIVVVDENKEGTVGLKLRDAGFECYPVVE